jgi:hypothetical protein
MVKHMSNLKYSHKILHIYKFGTIHYNAMMLSVRA